MSTKGTQVHDLVRYYDDAMRELRLAIDRDSPKEDVQRRLNLVEKRVQSLREYDTAAFKYRKRGVIFAVITAALMLLLWHGGADSTLEFFGLWGVSTLLMAFIMLISYCFGGGIISVEKLEKRDGEEIFARYAMFAGWLWFIYYLA